MVLVGHSYGGVVITAAGNDPKVVGLVYIAAFAPDKGESVSTLIKDPVPGAPVPPILPPQDGYLSLDSQVRCLVCGRRRQGKSCVHGRFPSAVGGRSANGTISEPAWKTKPSWYLVATDDRMIPPPAQRLMSKRAGSTVVEVKGSHAIYVSQPKAVAALIAKAALESTRLAHAREWPSSDRSQTEAARGVSRQAARHRLTDGVEGEQS